MNKFINRQKKETIQEKKVKCATDTKIYDKSQEDKGTNYGAPATPQRLMPNIKSNKFESPSKTAFGRKKRKNKT